MTVELAGLPVAAVERSACQPGVPLRLILLAEWGSWWVFGSQLRLSKVETFSILDLLNFKSCLTRNLDIIIDPTSVDSSIGLLGLYITI